MTALNTSEMLHALAGDRDPCKNYTKYHGGRFTPEGYAAFGDHVYEWLRGMGQR